VRFCEITYPRTTAWSLDDYARGIEGMLLARESSALAAGRIVWLAARLQIIGRF
jgi:hypothetical protein